MTERGWEADASALFTRRLGKSAKELKYTGGQDGCPDIWELDNGDVAIIGRDLTTSYKSRLPEGVVIADDESLVIIPGQMMRSARKDIPDV